MVAAHNHELFFDTNSFCIILCTKEFLSTLHEDI